MDCGGGFDGYPQNADRTRRVIEAQSSAGKAVIQVKSCPTGDGRFRIRTPLSVMEEDDESTRGDDPFQQETPDRKPEHGELKG